MATKKSEAETSTPAATTAPAPGTLVPQSHGGAIKTGGNPGNKGSPGRPPSHLRARLRDAAEGRVEVLEEIADGMVKIPIVGVCEHCGKTSSAEKMGLPEILKAVASPAERRAAIETMLRYGIGTQDEISLVSPEVREKIAQTIATIREELPRIIQNQPDPAAAAEQLVARLGTVWQ